MSLRVDRAAADLVHIAASTTTTSSSSTTSSSTTTTTLATVVAGGTVASDLVGTVLDSTNKVIASVTTPVAGSIGFVKTDGTSVAGYTPLAGVTITAPAGTVARPLRLTLDVDVTGMPTSWPLGSISVLRDTAPAGDCTSLTEAKPDPCVLSRKRTADKLTLRLLTAHASSWTLARPAVQRIFGDSRITSAVAASRSTFADGGAGAVVLVRSDGFADALAATPLAVAKKAPLLLTGSQALDDATLAEVVRVLPKGGTVYLLGGTGALSDDVVNRLLNWGYSTVRFAGSDRYETAVVVAEEGLGGPSVVVETTGFSFADALAAGAVAAHLGGAVLLTEGAEQSYPTALYLAVHAPTRYALGAPAAYADPDATAFAGDNRYETAALAAVRFFPTPGTIGAASGVAFADALAGGVHIAATGGPLLLLPPTGDLPISVVLYLQRLRASPPAAFLYGGTAAVADDVAAKLQVAAGL